MKIFFVVSLLLGPVFYSIQPDKWPAPTSAVEASEPAPVMSEGTVQQFNSRRGTGFIKPASSNKLVFVHASDTKERLTANQVVIYTVVKDSKGERAVQVQAKQP